MIAGWLQLPLPVILLLYSASFQVFYLIVILLLLWRYKQWGFAILLALYFTLFVSDVYYWPNNELHQGVAWMFIFFGIFFSRSDSGLKWFRHLLLILTGFLALSVILLWQFHALSSGYIVIMIAPILSTTKNGSWFILVFGHGFRG